MTTADKYCSSCGESIKAAAEICPHCGVRQFATPTQAVSGGKGKSKGTAILLALFLGGLGAHKFYLGRVAQGFFYILFVWTFVPAIIALIEMVNYITTSDEEFKRKYPS